MMEFSNRISTLKPSAIREILKIPNDPELISFSAGNPAPDSFPVEAMSKIASDIFATGAARALQYGISEGHTPLRDITKKRMSEKYGVGSENDDLIITSGGQQAIEMTAKIFLNEGDVVICEEPSFVGALNALRSYGVKLVGIPVDDDGMKVDLVEEKLKTEKNVKLIYTIPTFQNPTGTTMSAERRRKLLELADRYDVMILEDSPYFELRFRGERVPAIKSMDKNGRVIFAGSYSKILAPGIRIGFACASKEIIAKLTVAKQVSDVHTNLFFQMLAAEYLTQNDIDEHIAKICDMYRTKLDKMLECMEKKFTKKVTFTRPEGGLFVMCTMPDGFDGAELANRAKAAKVTVVPGLAFATDETKICPTFRLNFSLPSLDEIERGIDRLAKVLNEYVG
ncbi:MAG: PLP-dependent aminotransferase family protein [Oscillospiraceae bacterium]|nr:PLP-dependent aminotransferase family protein [Oscillospiraceae bacterium]